MIYNNFLEQLYYGNFSPADRRYDKQSKSYQISLLESDAQDKFRKKLSDELKKNLIIYFRYLSRNVTNLRKRLSYMHVDI